MDLILVCDNLNLNVCVFYIIDYSMWPEGSFSLPQSVYDCPQIDQFHWVRSHVSLRQSNKEPNPYSWSLEYHMRGPFGPNHVAINFCSKLNDFLSKEMIQKTPKWPKGSYCIFKLGEQCPTGANHLSNITDD